MVPYLGLSVLFIVIVHLLHTYLDVRQLKAIKLPKAPPALAGEGFLPVHEAVLLHAMLART